MKTSIAKSIATLVNDRSGVIAAKPASLHPDDAHLLVVARDLSHGGSHPGVHRFATHIFNSEDGGFDSGHYFGTEADVLADFKERGSV